MTKVREGCYAAKAWITMLVNRSRYEISSSAIAFIERVGRRCANFPCCQNSRPLETRSTPFTADIFESKTIRDTVVSFFFLSLFSLRAWQSCCDGYDGTFYQDVPQRPTPEGRQ